QIFGHRAERAHLTPTALPLARNPNTHLHIGLADVHTRASLMHHIHRPPLSSAVDGHRRESPRLKRLVHVVKATVLGACNKIPSVLLKFGFRPTPMWHDVSRRPEPDFHPLRVRAPGSGRLLKSTNGTIGRTPGVGFASPVVAVVIRSGWREA